MRSGQSNTGDVIIGNPTQRRRETNKSITINYGEASQLEVWQVARAATAAKFYFEPLKVENFRGVGSAEFTDGGFNYANNPTRTGIKEIQGLRGSNFIGIVVSVGTARKLKKDAKKATFFSTIPNSAREFAEQATDPEVVHNELQGDHDHNPMFPYFRLNEPGGLQTELDEWEPKRKMFSKKEGGAKTIAEIEGAYNRWAAIPTNIDLLKECAAALVKCRRTRMETSKWERYATASQYRCRFEGCEHPEFFERQEFATHLRGHSYEDNILKNEISERRKHWRYQASSRL